MKPFLFFMVLMFCGLHTFSQIQYSAELAQKLTGKTNFQEVKSTVTNHYREKLAVLSPRDSVERKRMIRQLKMWNRQFWINENYTNVQGKVASSTKVIARAFDKRKQEIITSGNLSQAQSENWVQDGPISSTFSLLQGEGLGRIDRIAFHPTEPNVLFAGSPHGGLFKTTNSGEEWFPISEYVASLGVSGIAIHPTNPDIIYVLSGDGESGNGGFVDTFHFRSASNGVYKTTDGGNTWNKLPDFPGITDETIYQGRNLVMDPNNANVLLAATSTGLFRTSNAGINWSVVTGTENMNIWDVKFKPNNSNTVYCVGDNFFKRSQNNGISFGSIAILALDTATRISLAVTPANPNRVMLFAGNKNSNSCIGVFTSPNSGDTFTKYGGSAGGQPNFFHNYIDEDVTLNQCNYNNAIAISPINENIVLIGGLCIWASTDAGVNWEQATAYWPTSDILHEYIHPDIHSIAWNPINGTVYCTNDAGVYKSTDEGDDWDYIETGLSTTQFYHFELENDDGNTWGGAQDNGILERLNYGEFGVYKGGDGYDVMTDHPWRTANGNSNNIYYTVNQSIRGDATDISVPNNTDYFGNLAMNPQDEDYIYVGYQTSIYRSGDAGGTWYDMDNVPGNWSIAAGTNHPLRIYSSGVNASHEGGIWRNDWPYWDTLRTQLEAAGYNRTLKITDIEVDKLNDDKVFISVAGVSPNAKVFKTANGGTSWTNITYNLPNVPAFSIKQDELGGLYAGTSIGVYYKEVGNDYWVPFYNGLPAVPVTQIELSANRVHISTFGRGLWSTAKATNCTDNLTLTGPVVGRNYYEVSDYINSTQTILNSPGTNIIYSAGNKITFKPGTHIQKGAKFRGKVQPCGSPVEF